MKINQKTAILSSVTTLVVVGFLTPALATQYQQCATNATCQIGEFLYDDNYAPISGASCTLNVKDPSGTTILNNVAMTGNSDGWYSYDVSVGETSGAYRSQLCCNASGDYLCIDKTFEASVGTGDIAAETADAVWGDSRRNTFISDIWNHSSDSLGSFATKITSIFNRSETIETNTNTINSNINSVSNQVDAVSTQIDSTTAAAENQLAGLLSQNRELLEQLINAPVIENFISQEEDVPLSDKIDAAASAVNAAYSTTQTVKAKLTTLLSKWSTLTATKIDAELTSVMSLLGTSADTQSSSLMGNLNLLLQGWDSPLITSTADAAGNTITSLSATQNILLSAGIDGTEFQDALIESLTVVDALEESVGDTSDSLASTTLYGFLKKITSSADSFGTTESDIDQLIQNYSQFSDKEIKYQVTKLTNQVLANNQIRGAEILLKDPTNPDSPHPKSLLYGLKGIISLNRSGISTSGKNPISKLWLQDQAGSIIVRGFIYNPSTTTQTSQVKYLLPIEILPEHVLGKSDTLTVEYSAPDAAMLVTGNYEISPKQITSFYVQVKDLWALSAQDLETYATQAQELVNSLRNTSLFAQANSIKSDIQVTLDKIKIKISGVLTPEDRIAAVRAAQLDLLSVQEKMQTLKDMVSETTSAKSIVGAMGGVQAVSVWGLILIFISGFVFLVVFMRRMQPVAAGVGIHRSVIAHPIPLSQGHNPTRVRVPRKPIRTTDFAPTMPKLNTPYGKLALTLVMTIGLATVVVSLINRTSQKNVAPMQSPSNPKFESQGLQFNTDSQTESSPTADSNTPTTDSSLPTTDSPSTVLGASATEMMLEVTNDSINIYSQGSSDAKIVMNLTESQYVYVFDIKTDSTTKTSFSRIGFSENDDQKDWWVETTLLSSP